MKSELAGQTAIFFLCFNQREPANAKAAPPTVIGSGTGSASVSTRV